MTKLWLFILSDAWTCNDSNNKCLYPLLIMNICITDSRNLCELYDVLIVD